MSEINNKQKYYLSRFLEETYNLPIESVSKHINEEYDVPENIQDLEFVKNRSIHARSETVHRYNPEFIAKSEYLNEYIKFHLGSVPGTKEGYIKQLDVPEENRFKVRENPNLVFGAYMKDEDIENLNSEILSTVGDLSSYNEDINNDRLQDVLKLCYALFRYSINEGSTADINNVHRLFSYITSNSEVSRDRVEHSYHKAGFHLSNIFDGEFEEIPDYLYEYYDGNLYNLVETVKLCDEEYDE